MDIRSDAQKIMDAALKAALPDTAVQTALADLPPVAGKLILVAAGKAAWQMAQAAWKELRGRIDGGVVITKHNHAQGPIGNLTICEAGHPVPDQDSYTSTQIAIDMVQNLTGQDLVLFLLSGGGSALFEKPLISPEEMDDITHQLLASGADIVEINTLRKRLSAVKGGKFAQLCSPAKVFSVVLSDILGDPLDMIASGNLRLSPQALALLEIETPKELDNVDSRITGSVRQLCAAASATCQELGYQPIVLTANLACEAREAGSFLGAIAQFHQDTPQSVAYIAGGETVVHLTGHGMGGRNQEIALSGAKAIDGLKDTLIFSLGSDGTDGPTDAAGGIADGTTAAALREKGISIDAVLKDNDAYHALKAVDGLIFTGPTGTNVNDLTCLLIKR